MVRFWRPRAPSTQAQVSPRVLSGHGQVLEASCIVYSSPGQYPRCKVGIVRFWRPRESSAQAQVSTQGAQWAWSGSGGLVNQLLKPWSVPRVHSGPGQVLEASCIVYSSPGQYPGCTVGLVRFWRPRESSTQAQVSPRVHSGHGQVLEASCIVYSRPGQYPRCTVGIVRFWRPRESSTQAQVSTQGAQWAWSGSGGLVNCLFKFRSVPRVHSGPGQVLEASCIVYSSPGQYPRCTVGIVRFWRPRESSTQAQVSTPGAQWAWSGSGGLVNRLLKPWSVPRVHSGPGQVLGASCIVYSSPGQYPGCTVGLVSFWRPRESSTQAQVSPRVHSGHGQVLEASCIVYSSPGQYPRCTVGIVRFWRPRESSTQAQVSTQGA